MIPVTPANSPSIIRKKTCALCKDKFIEDCPLLNCQENKSLALSLDKDTLHLFIYDLLKENNILKASLRCRKDYINLDSRR